MGATRARSTSRPAWTAHVKRIAGLAVLTIAVAALLPAGIALAGTASTGTLLFYPCTSCHPITIDAAGNPSHPFPEAFKDFKGHGIKLESHDVLGKDEAACLVCHDDAEHNPGMLHAVDGTLIDAKTGDIAKLCQKCHYKKYQDFVAGIHGKGFTSCVVAGCHDPHTPNYIYITPLKPFFGTGVQIRGVGLNRVPFTPVMPPAVQPPTTNPLWFVIASDIGMVLAVLIFGGLAAPALFERLKR